MKKQFLVTVESSFFGATPNTTIEEVLLNETTWTRVEAVELEPDKTEEFNTLMTTLEMQDLAAGEVLGECTIC
jgi:hypothetical protein